MNFFHSIILGLTQGLTEFLPVSSSGHLVLLENLFGLESAETSNLFFDVLLHLGTLVAVVIAFRQDILELLKDFWQLICSLVGRKRLGNRPSPTRRLLLLLVVATLPLVVGLLFKDWLEGIRTMPWLVGIALIVTGVLLFASDTYRGGKKTERSSTVVDALMVGAMQCMALIPGLSRSGSTISAGIFRGFDRKFAVKFSFLLSLPAVLGATVLETTDAVKTGIDWSLTPIYLAGMLVAGVSGYFAIKLMRYVAEKGKFGWFAYYCWAAGALTIIASLVTK